MSYYRGRHLRQHLPELVKRQGRLCALCGQELDLKLFNRVDARTEVDHLVSFSQGGSNDISNLAAAHSSCNRKKHARNIYPLWMNLDGWSPPPIPNGTNPRARGFAGWLRQGLAKDAVANWIRDWHRLNPQLGDGVRRALRDSIERQGGRCVICRQELATPKLRHLRLYHLVPSSVTKLDGTWIGEFRNASSIALAHPNCNLTNGLRRVDPNLAPELQIPPPDTGFGFVATAGCLGALALIGFSMLMAIVSGPT